MSSTNNGLPQDKPPANQPPLIGASFTHPGLLRENNEDAIKLHIPQSMNGYRRGLLMVADGIGGHLAGEVASNLAVETAYESLLEVLEAPNPPSPAPALDAGSASLENHLAALLKQTLERANRVIFEYSRQHWEQAGNLGTTATCGLVYNDLLLIAHVGDSRAYLLRDSRLQQLTEDHTFVGEMVRRGQFPPNAYYDHPRRHVIIQALGQKPEVQVDVYDYQLQPGDRLLFCSDGLWEMVRDEGIKDHLSSAASPQDAIERLFSSAMRAGGVDNIGIVVGEIYGR